MIWDVGRLTGIHCSDGIYSQQFAISRSYLDSLRFKDNEDYHANSIYLSARATIGHTLTLCLKRATALNTNDEPESI